MVDLLAEGVEATVRQTIRETVEAVQVLAPSDSDGVMKKAVAKRLNIDAAAACRRCQVALDSGYVRSSPQGEMGAGPGGVRGGRGAF